MRSYVIFAGSTEVTTSWRLTWKLPACIWKTRTLSKLRLTSIEPLSCRQTRKMNSSRSTTRCHVTCMILPRILFDLQTLILAPMPSQVCYARVLDYRRKFIEAAQRYNELSYKTVVAEGERITALRNALICTILASAGELKSQIHSKLTTMQQLFFWVLPITTSFLIFLNQASRDLEC